MSSPGGFEIASGFINVSIRAAGAISGLGAIATAAGAAGAALSALPAAAAAAGSAFAVIGSSFSGVGDALKAYEKDQDNATKSGRKAASQAASNARQIRNAQKSIEDARKSAARTARDSAKAIEDAEESVREAAEDAAEAITAAKRDQTRVAEDGAERIRAAGERVADAQQNEVRAQEDLTRAREDAARTLQDLREQTEDFALDEEGAAIRVAKAEERLREVMVDRHASVADRRAAEHELAVARDAQADMTRDHTRALEELNEAEQKGVEGSDKVITAKERVADAEEAVTDAQRAQERTARDVAEATQDAAAKVAKAVKDGAERQAQAEERLADTRAKAAEANADAAEQVADAVQGLKDIQDQQAESALDAAAAANTYADELAKLTPAQRDLVEQIVSMKPALRELQMAGSEKFLPGVTQMLKDSENLFPILEKHLAATGELLGNTARDLGKLFKSADFQDDLEKYLDNTLAITKAMGDGFVQATEDIVDFGAQMDQSALGFAGFIDSVSAGFGAFLDSLEPFDETFRNIWDSFGTIAETLLPAIGTAIGNIASFVAPVLENIANFLEDNKDSLDEWITGLALLGGAIAGFTVVGRIVPGIISFVNAFSGLGTIAMSTVGVLGLVVGGVVAAGFALDAMTTSTDELVESIGRGETSFAELVKRQREILEVKGDVEDGTAAWEMYSGQVNVLGDELKSATPSAEEFNEQARLQAEAVRAAEEEWNKYLQTLSPMEQLQANVGRAQGELNDAIVVFGKDSPEAAAAAANLAYYSNQLKDAQSDAEDATKSHTQALRDQQDQMLAMADANLGMRQAQLDLKQAQDDLTAAVRDYGAGSDQAEQAQLRFEGAQLRVIQASDRQTEAQSRGRTETEKAEIATANHENAVRFLSDTLGNKVTPSVQAYIDELNKIPPSVKTIVSADGRYTIMQNALDPNQKGGIASAGRLATGGILPGYTPGRDVHMFMSPTGGALALSGGEAVLRPEVTKALGAQWVHGVNKAARSGGVDKARKFVLGEGILGDTGVTASGQPAFADGGIFNPHDMAQAVQAARTVRDTTISLQTQSLAAEWKRFASQGGAGLAFARSQVGKPYIWGAVGPAGYDCSGFMSAILNVMRGQNPHRRVGATANFPWAGFRPGFGPGLNIGSTKNTGSGIGHMAGTIGGVNVESRGGVGPIVGPRARGAGDSLFNTVAHWAPGYAGGGGGFSGALGALIDTVAVGGVRAAVQAVANRRGWGGGNQWGALSWLINKESSWNPNAQNPRSTAYGLFQFLNGTWATVGGRKTSDPALQAEYGLRYIASRYGTPAGAQAFHMRRGYYDDGGMLPPGTSIVQNNTGKPEPVLSPDQWNKMQSGTTFNNCTFQISSNNAEQLFNELEQISRKGGKYRAGVKVR